MLGQGDEDDGIVNDEGGLLPVVVFSFSKKQCEINADFFKGQDLLTKREKGKVAKLWCQVVQLSIGNTSDECNDLSAKGGDAHQPCRCGSTSDSAIAGHAEQGHWSPSRRIIADSQRNC